jgi:hypothetical protein
MTDHFGHARRDGIHAEYAAEAEAVENESGRADARAVT